jgi:hypothetical protein
MLALRLRFLPFLVLVVLATPIGILVGVLVRRENANLDNKSSGAEARPLAIAESCLNIGEIWEQPSFKWLLRLENRTDDEIKIGRFNSSCSCTSIKPESFTISPRQSKEIELTIDLTAKSSKKREDQAETEEFAVNIQPAVQKNTGSIFLDSWEIKGKVKRILDLDKAFVDFGRRSERLRPISPHSIRITSRATLSGLTVTSRSDFFQVDTRPMASAGNTAYELMIRPVGNLSVGSYRAMLEVTAHLADGPSVRCADIPIALEILADIQATPSQINLGAKLRGEICSEAIVLHSLTHTPFKVRNHRIEHAEQNELTKPTVDRGPMQSFILSQEISHTGRQRFSVFFSVELADGTTSEVMVPFEYHGLSSK